MIEINYVHTRVRTTDYIYDVELDGEWIAAACNYSAADRVAQDVTARQQLLAMIEDAVKQARQQAQIEQGWDYAECPCGDQALYFTQYANGKVYAYCPECWQEFGTPTLANPPLLAQCADVIRRCLGRASGPEGIIDELRRVEAQLSREGW